MKITFTLAMVVALFLTPFGAIAAKESLVGTWLVTVEGEAKTRSLIISEEALTDGAVIQAKYGMSVPGAEPIEAKMLRATDQRQLQLVTQASTKIVVTEQSDGNFKGTFALKNGTVKDVTIARVSIQAQPTVATSGLLTIQKPGADVPVNCAAFSGGWGGEWPRVGYASLWVVSIDASCNAKVVYPAGPKTPKATQPQSPAMIKGDVLSLTRPDGGTTKFELSGGGISANYSGPSGVNNTTLQRIDNDPALQARAEADQKAAMATVPPAPDVPSACAAFYGQWSGTWSQGGLGELYLRVAEVKSVGDKCLVRYSYTPSRTPVPAKDTVEVQRGAITFVCNSSTGGTCVFARNGDIISASYTNPGGGRNDGTFKRIE